MASKTRSDVLRDFRTEQILSAARRVIAKRGYPDASLAHIAEEAGVAKGTLYLYFENKDSLLAAIYALGHDQMLERVRGRVASASSPEETLRSALRAMFEHFEEELAFARAVAAFPAVGPAGSSAGSEAIRNCVALHIELFAGWIREGIESGAFRGHDPADSARLLNQLAYAQIAERVLGDTAEAPEGAAARILDYFLRGIAA